MKTLTWCSGDRGWVLKKGHPKLEIWNCVKKWECIDVLWPFIMEIHHVIHWQYMRHKPHVDTHVLYSFLHSTLKWQKKEIVHSSSQWRNYNKFSCSCVQNQLITPPETHCITFLSYVSCNKLLNNFTEHVPLIIDHFETTVSFSFGRFFMFILRERNCFLGNWIPLSGMVKHMDVCHALYSHA